jgi:mono/diheme cytochrome c family protein
MLKMWKTGLPIALTFLAVSTVAAQTAGDSERGREAAERACMSCHAASRSGPPGLTDLAPDFTSIAALPSTTPVSLRVFLQTPHQRLPSNILSPTEINDVVAYIMSLRRSI